MSQIRQRATLRSSDQHMIEINAPGKHIPLQQNWTNRWCTLGSGFQSFFDKIYNFEVYDDDVFVVTFPKCGTTWMQEAAWLLLNDLNFKKATEEQLWKRSVFLDASGVNNKLQRDTVEDAAKLSRPRLIKSHLPASLIPHQIWEKKTKIIYVARNPKDVVCSYYTFFKNMGKWKGTIDEYVDELINSDSMYAPYWPHVLDFWYMRDEPQIFFTTYEKMKQDLKSVLIDLNRFLGKPPLSDENLAMLLKHLSFESMKANNKTNLTETINGIFKNASKDLQFMRRGITGAYRDELSEENQRKIDEWSKKSLEGESVTENDIFGSLDSN